MFKILSVGEAILDIIISVPGNILCPAGKSSCDKPLLCFDYGSKLEIKDTMFGAGGTAANLAVAIARLGGKSSLAAIIAPDQFGDLILKKIKNERVSLKYIARPNAAASAYSFIINGPTGDRTIFIDRGSRDYSKLKIKKLIKEKNIFLGPVPASQKNFYYDFIKAVLPGVSLYLNPSSFQLRDKKTLLKLLKKTKILFLNKEEAQALVGKFQDTKKLLALTSRLGPKIVVITEGARGALSYDGKDYFSTLAFLAKKVDATGAGDAFAATFIYIYQKTKNIEKALKWAAVNSASVVEKYGAQTGLLTNREIQKRLKMKKGFIKK